ncbi:MAG: hypothetical protein KKB81_08290 [Candidatus Margulisbacteria bacterium]|nr:hypothetical protein [Candidatus Margulisiibacteriota bacterium]MBU1021705.1 hypothetical protein [Candidatus Margulisiibacteriota bacterium]MBU1729451.1 hypothetical protein [Candidatus Margulisiibacteriota bacterium]MBU1955448.1 hypothetical protein [Candidatus Margulisiibacteriota bacterium]
MPTVGRTLLYVHLIGKGSSRSKSHILVAKPWENTRILVPSHPTQRSPQFLQNDFEFLATSIQEGAIGFYRKISSPPAGHPVQSFDVKAGKFPQARFNAEGQPPDFLWDASITLARVPNEDFFASLGQNNVVAQLSKKSLGPDTRVATFSLIECNQEVDILPCGLYLAETPDSYLRVFAPFPHDLVTFDRAGQTAALQSAEKHAGVININLPILSLMSVTDANLYYLVYFLRN